MFIYPENWKSLSSDEKQEARLAHWISGGGIKFATAEAEETYKRRAQRVKDILQLKKPDRIPCFPQVDAFMADYAGIPYGDFLYDYDKTVQAVIKFYQDFQPDYNQALLLPGKVYDRLGMRTYRWPGDGLPIDTKSYQMVESDYMKADEYDQLINNPEGYYMRTYMPRAFKALEGFGMLPTWFYTMEMPFVPMLTGTFAAPPVQEAFKAFLDAGQLTAEYMGAIARISEKLTGEMGLPAIMGGFSKVSFDVIGDTLRGTKGIMLDLYRQPDKVLSACERLLPISIEIGVQGANMTGCPFVFLVLHKGADGFLSDEQFKKFYWPFLKGLILGLIDNGCVPFAFAEGSYNDRLDTIAESGLPKGKTMWWFDQTNMEVAKKKFGNFACIGGNVPTSMFLAAKPQEIEDYVKNLIDTIGQDGGFFVAPGADIDMARPENIHAFIDTVRKYGIYS